MTAVEKIIAKYEKQWNKYGMGSFISYSQVISDLKKLKKVEKSQSQETWCAFDDDELTLQLSEIDSDLY